MHEVRFHDRHVLGAVGMSAVPPPGAGSRPHRLQAALEFSERRYRHLASSAGDLVTLHAPDRTLLAAWGNGNIPTLRDPASMLGSLLELVVHEEDAEHVSRAWDAASFGREQVAVCYRVERAPDDWAWVETRILALRDTSGELVELQTVNRDVTEQRSFQHELALLALRDPLTGLANRLLFGDRMRAAATRMDRRGGLLAILLLDVDRFKGVNDSLGHSIGDQLLKELGARLSGVVRASDTVARLSGDEFAVLAEDLESLQAAERLADRALTALQPPYELPHGFTVTVTPSIGMTVSADAKTDPDDLLGQADAALYAAKAAGRNRVAVFDARLRREIRQRRSLDQQARRALAADDLFCEYQPVIDLEDGATVLAEAFVRLRDEDGTVLRPREFLPVCESTGLVTELDRKVLAAVLRDIALIRSGGGRWCPVVSVNLSARTLTDPRLPELVADLLDEFGLEGGGLTFELADPVLPVGGSGLERTVAQLAEMGIGIGLDDFGRGSSALSTLTALEIDYLKLDGGFLASARTGAVAMSVGRAVIDLGRALGLAVVGQGIERHEQLVMLMQLGCTLGQGAGLSAPVPLADIPQRLPHPGQPAIRR